MEKKINLLCHYSQELSRALSEMKELLTGLEFVSNEIIEELKNNRRNNLKKKKK